MTVHAVAQKPLRRCLLLSGQPRRSRGDCGQAEVCSQTEMCGEPKAIPLVDAPIRERDAIKEAECCSPEDILVLGCREGLEGGDVIHHKGMPLSQGAAPTGGLLPVQGALSRQGGGGGVRVLLGINFLRVAY